MNAAIASSADDEGFASKPAKGKHRSAAGQEGRTVEGDDSGQTPASLAAAYTSAAVPTPGPKSFPMLGTACLAIALGCAVL